jgi:hypothetical protein
MYLHNPIKQEQKRLLELFARLEQSDQDTLLAFAEFLATRPGHNQAAASAAPPAPLPAPRPAAESVVAAIKRLSASYFMLDRPELLNETSVLMTQHVMQGRAAEAVIDDLEALFQRFYQELLAAHHSGR